MSDCCGGPQVPIAPIVPCTRAIGTDTFIENVGVNPILFSGVADASELMTDDRPDFSPADAPAMAKLTRLATVDQKIHYGFADACFPPGHNRFGNYEVNNPSNWWRFIEILAYSYDSWKDAAGRAQYHWPALQEGRFYENTASVIPGALYAITDDTLMIFVSGSSTYQQLALQAASSFSGPVTCGSVKTSAFWCSSYNVLWNQLYSRMFPARPYVVVAGHSYGAVMASLFAQQIKETNPDKDVSLITYGCPALGDKYFSDALWDIRAVHLVNYGDPVASIPPAGSQLTVLNLFLEPLQLLAWRQWHPLRNRTAIYDDGTYAFTSDVAADLGVLQVLAQELSDGDIPAPFEAHDQWEYTRRLRITAGLPPL